ncbi:MAG: carbohydrate kinase [Gemmataceae bacterium]
MNQPIVGIGELLWDIYPDGRKVAGGAPFNFAFHCHQLGHEAVIVSRVGDDELGRELREEVRRLGLSDAFIQTDREHPTGTVTVSLDANKVPTYTINENVAWDYIGAEVASLEEGVRHNVRAICFGTLALRSPVSRHSILNEVRGGAHMLRVLDVNIRKPHTPSAQLIRECSEDANWIKVSVDDLDAVETPLDFDHCDAASLLIVTRGLDGFEIHNAEGRVLQESAVPAKVIDTVGAGDAFTAAMVCLHLEGKPLRECARFANRYAARVCEHQGATPRIDRAEVEAAL